MPNQSAWVCHKNLARKYKIKIIIKNGVAGAEKKKKTLLSESGDNGLTAAPDP